MGVGSPNNTMQIAAPSNTIANCRQPRFGNWDFGFSDRTYTMAQALLPPCPRPGLGRLWNIGSRHSTHLDDRRSFSFSTEDRISDLRNFIFSASIEYFIGFISGNLVSFLNLADGAERGSRITFLHMSQCIKKNHFYRLSYFFAFSQ